MDNQDYSDSIAESMKSQMLLNLVKLRYGDLPFFLDVKSVIKSYTLETELGAGVEWTVGGGVDPDLGITGTFADRPTVSYAPLAGDEYAQTVMTPVDPETLVQLLQAGVEAEFIFRMTVDEINGVTNRRLRGMGIREEEPEFRRIVELLQTIQDEGSLDFQVRSRDQQALLYLTENPSGVGREEIAELKRLLRIAETSQTYRLIYGKLAANPGEIALLTRSIMAILSDLSGDVDIPEEDVEAGRATPGFGNENRFIRIHSGNRDPGDAYVKVPYRDRWFWIADDDIRSKMIFTNILTIFNLTGTGRDRIAPIITIPTGG